MVRAAPCTGKPVFTPPAKRSSSLILWSFDSKGDPDELSIICYLGRKAPTYKALLHIHHPSLYLRLSVQYLSTLCVPPVSHHICLSALRVKDRVPSRRAEDGAAPVGTQKELVSIKCYVLMPQITDTCFSSRLPPCGFCLSSALPNAA